MHNLKIFANEEDEEDEKEKSILNTYANIIKSMNRGEKDLNLD